MNNTYDPQSEFEYALDHNEIVHVDLKGAQVLAFIEGEHDGSTYHWFVQTPRNTYVYIWGGCDYTGWDCQSNLDASEEYKTVNDINPMLLFAGTDDNNIAVRDLMIKQLHGLFFSGKFISTVNETNEEKESNETNEHSQHPGPSTRNP